MRKAVNHRADAGFGNRYIGGVFSDQLIILHMQDPHLIIPWYDIGGQLNRCTEQCATDNRDLLIIHLPQPARGHIAGQRPAPQPHLLITLLQICCPQA